jgi:phosphoribosylglycinamide formyltransferase-1
MKLAILGSTRGTDALSILKNIQNGILRNTTVECIISNRSKAQILEKGEKFGIPSVFVSAKLDDGVLMTREQYDQKLDAILQMYKVDYIVLVGWMRIMSKQFVDKWENRILNIHPSLLPAFAGDMDLNIHRAVLQRGCKITGATLMFIDDGADTGPIIDQKVVTVSSEDDPESLKQKVQAAEQQLFADNLPLLRDGKLKVENNKVTKI